MITLSSAHDYVVLFAFAALFGAIGGIAYELTQRRLNETGSIELPGLLGKRFIELGVLSSMILGAAAAVAISYFFTPEVQVKSTVNGLSVIQTKWQIVKVIPLSLIVGSAGGAFLEAMRGRILGQLNAQKAATVQAVSKANAAGVAHVAKKLLTQQHAASGGRIKTVGSTAIADALDQAPESLRVEALKLTADTPQNAAMVKLFENFKAQPLSHHIDRLSKSIDEPGAAETQTASDVIDSSLEAANAAIDAAATALPA